MHNVKSLHSNGPHLEEIFHLYIFKGMKQMTFNNIICIILFVLVSKYMYYKVQYPNSSQCSESSPEDVATARYTEWETHPLPEPLRDITQHTGNTAAAPATYTQKKTFETRMNIRNSVIVYAE